MPTLRVIHHSERVFRVMMVNFGRIGLDRVKLGHSRPKINSDVQKESKCIYHNNYLAITKDITVMK